MQLGLPAAARGARPQARLCRRQEGLGAESLEGGPGGNLRVVRSLQLAARAVLPRRAPHVSAQSGQGETAFICLKSASPALKSWTSLGKIWEAFFFQEAFQQTGSPDLGAGKRFLTFLPGGEQNKMTPK